MKNWMCDSVELDLANTFATPIKHFDTDDGYRKKPLHPSYAVIQQDYKLSATDCYFMLRNL
jgi:hypothetical protein